MALRQTLTLGVFTEAFTFTSNVSANDTVVIGDQTYTFVATPGTTANNVDIGGDLATSILNLVAAINLSGTPGTEYGNLTVVNPYVTATAAATTIDLTARVAGAEINGLYVAATSPGANDIAVESVVFGLGANTGHADGAGSVATFLSDIQTYMQPNAEISAYIAGMTAAAD